VAWHGAIRANALPSSPLPSCKAHGRRCPEGAVPVRSRLPPAVATPPSHRCRGRLLGAIRPPGRPPITNRVRAIRHQALGALGEERLVSRPSGGAGSWDRPSHAGPSRPAAAGPRDSLVSRAPVHGGREPGAGTSETARGGRRYGRQRPVVRTGTGAAVVCAPGQRGTGGIIHPNPMKNKNIMAKDINSDSLE
jgi:hypothetical protein